VENAIKHGVSVLETAGRVSVHAALRDGALWIEVRDNGPGFPAGFSLAEPGGHGLRNIAERVRGYYGDCAQLGWESRPAGTRVFLKMPQPAPDPDGRSFSDTRSDRRR
jgi:two-component system sensor histidine kinase YesM